MTRHTRRLPGHRGLGRPPSRGWADLRPAQGAFVHEPTEAEADQLHVLLRETDPGLVFLEMDIFWAYVAQFRFSKRPDGKPAHFEPLDYVLRRPDRYPLFHVKDGESDPSNPFGYRMVDVGDGDIDYQKFIWAVTRLKGHRLAHHWQVEHDNPALAGRARQPRRVLHLRPPLR